MMLHRRFRRLPLVIFLAALLVVPGAAVVSPGHITAAAQAAPVPVLSGLESTGRASLGRDCGYSEPLPASPGRSLWLFCDTPVYLRTANGRGAWRLMRFINGSTAAESASTRGRLPGKLTEKATPGTDSLAQHGAAPEPFLPAPAGLVTLAGLPCDAADGAYAASWITGATRIPASPDLLITFNNYCVQTGAAAAFLPEGFGLVEYDPAANMLSNQVTVFPGIGPTGPAPAQLLGSPIFTGGYLYLFGPSCSDPALSKCPSGRIFVARVGATPLAWMNPLSYTWWAGGGLWIPDPAVAASIIPGARPSAVSVEDFSAVRRGLVLIEQNDIDGRFTVYEARSPVAPWRRVTSGRVPCRTGSGYVNFCRAIIGHPEFSTRTRLYLSFFNPAARDFGHVMAETIRW